MIAVLANRTFRHLFAAQVLSLLGSGLATIALGLLAFDLAAENAGAVLGTALAIKMIAFVGISPIASAYAVRFARRGYLVTLDVCRAGMVLLLPFVTDIWQIYLLVFLFQGFSAAFTPVFQATIPDILDSERDYTHALSLSRLAYDLEAMLSPALAALLLAFVSFHWLFLGTALGFLASAALVLSIILPMAAATAGTDDGFLARVTRGSRIYLSVPRLRGLLALSLAVSAAGAMVIVNTVVFVRAVLGGTDQDVALFFMVYGVGSMIVALLLPRLLEHVHDRQVMMAGTTVLLAGLGAVVVMPGFAVALGIWTVLGAGAALVQTPAGRLLVRSAQESDRPLIFAAHFALSHACWLLTYPLAGWIGSVFGLPVAFGVMAVLAGIGLVLASILWPDNGG